MKKALISVMATSVMISSMGVFVSSVSATSEYKVIEGKLIDLKTKKVARGYVVYKKKLYKNGKLNKGYAKVGTGNSVKLYYNATLKKGQKIATVNKEQLLFVDGILANGVIGDVDYQNGKKVEAIWTPLYPSDWEKVLKKKKKIQQADTKEVMQQATNAYISELISYTYVIVEHAEEENDLNMLNKMQQELNYVKKEIALLKQELYTTHIRIFDAAIQSNCAYVESWLITKEQAIADVKNYLTRVTIQKEQDEIAAGDKIIIDGIGYVVSDWSVGEKEELYYVSLRHAKEVEKTYTHMQKLLKNNASKSELLFQRTKLSNAYRSLVNSATNQPVFQATQQLVTLLTQGIQIQDVLKEEATITIIEARAKEVLPDNMKILIHNVTADVDAKLFFIDFDIEYNGTLYKRGKASINLIENL